MVEQLRSNVISPLSSGINEPSYTLAIIIRAEQFFPIQSIEMRSPA